ncbi:MAG: hypothetical protein JRJ68_01320 [Deltaproteobacteria bacterium]|nr:hypothetical protein [Deltaproteobacteria bacterium]
MKFIRKKRERRAAALIALTLEKKGDCGDCLTAEEMASLVQGNCSALEKERGWAHLSACSRCYEQWYFLKSGEKRPEKEGVLISLSRRKNLALAGSALAVAASVAVFLNVIHDPLPGQLAEKAETSFAPVESDGMVDKASSREDSEMVLEITGKAGDRLPTVKQMRRKTAAVLEGKGKISKLTLQSKTKIAGFTEPEAAAGFGKPDPVEKWLGKVEKGCLSKRRGEDFWAEIIRSGEHLLPETADKVDLHGSEIKAMAILQMVPRLYDSDSITKQCDLIIARLAEEGNNR